MKSNHEMIATEVKLFIKLLHILKHYILFQLEP